MADDGHGARRTDYGTARIGAALALVAVVVVVVLIDAMSTEYEANALLMTSILGAAAALLGVEVIDLARRK